MYSEGYPVWHAGVGVSAMKSKGNSKFGTVVDIDPDSFCPPHSLHFMAWSGTLILWHYVGNRSRLDMMGFISMKQTVVLSVIKMEIQYLVRTLILECNLRMI